MKKTRKFLAATFASGLMAVGIAAPTASAQPIFTGGLVNVTITNVLNNNTVTVPIGVAANIAANVCVGDLQVGVLASQIARGQTVECVAENGDALVMQRVRNA